jgi:serine/threonine protein kinase
MKDILSDAVFELLQFGYNFEKLLEGGREGGKVLLCEKSSQHVVIKAHCKEMLDAQEMENERIAGETLRKKGLINLKASFESKNYKYLVLEYVEAVDLWHFMDNRAWAPLSEREAKKIFRQIAKSIRFCHDHGVAHKVIDVLFFL